MTASKMTDSRSERQRALLDEIRILKSRLASLERRKDWTPQDHRRLNQILLDAIPCVALLLRAQTREIVALNQAAQQAGAVLGHRCFRSWAGRDCPCSWCLAPEAWATGKAQDIEVEAQGRIWDTHWQPISDDLYLHYAMDITERKQTLNEMERLAKFPSENPNPVMRVSEAGDVIYANAASTGLLTLWACREGKTLPDHWRGMAIKALAEGRPHKCEVNCEDRMYSLTFAPVKQAGFVNIYGLDVTEHKRVERERVRLLHDARERVEKLTCMCGVVQSIHAGKTTTEMLQDVVMLIPAGWHYPEMTRSKICFEHREFVSEPFGETPWKLISPIRAHGEVCGSVEVYYLEPYPAQDEGPFMKEERHLLDVIARSLGEAIEHRRTEKDLRHEIDSVTSELAQLRRELLRKTDLAKLGQAAGQAVAEMRSSLDTARNSVFLLRQQLGQVTPEMTDHLDIINAQLSRSDRVLVDLLDVLQTNPRQMQNSNGSP